MRAAIWPPQLDGFQRRSVTAIPLPATDAAVWKEYGWQAAERAEYVSAAQNAKFVVEAWRLADATSATAAAQWLTAQTPGSVVHAEGNYALRFSPGYRPTAKQLAAWPRTLEKFQFTAAPTLAGFLPGENRIAGSERFLIGNASLAAFLPFISAPTAALEAFSAEAQVAQYRLAGEPEPVTAAIFRYPTPAIAKQQLPLFEARLQGVPGAVTKRAGPTISLVVRSDGGPLQPASAEAILKSIRFDTIFGYTETVPTKFPDVAGLLIALFQLVGVLLAAALAGGAMVAAYLIFTRNRREATDPAMTRLRLRD